MRLSKLLSPPPLPRSDEPIMSLQREPAKLSPWQRRDSRPRPSVRSMNFSKKWRMRSVVASALGSLAAWAMTSASRPEPSRTTHGVLLLMASQTVCRCTDTAHYERILSCLLKLNEECRTIKSEVTYFQGLISTV